MQMVLICGLPCSGKTTWAQKHAEENPEKHYNVIGVVPVLEKMKVSCSKTYVVLNFKST